MSNQKRRIRWSMLLSHHAPCDYDRTCLLGQVRVCTRCLGVLLGTALALVLLPEESSAGYPVSMAAAIPGVLDFTLHELGVRRSSPAVRLLSGGLFGLFLAELIHAVQAAEVNMVVLYVGWFLLLQLGSGLVLSRAGKLDRLLERYEQGAHINSTE